MNIYKSLNEITKYIDDNLEEKIDYGVLAKMLGVNAYTLQRLFSLITGISLSDYIRKRRLSSSGYDIYNYKMKVIDVAVKYNYENPTSFSRAFENFHGIKPSMVVKETKLKNYPRIIFNENVKIHESIDYEIIELGELELYGLGIDTCNENISVDAPMFFRKIEDMYQEKYGKIKYGMVSYKDESRFYCNKYHVLYDKKIDDFEKIIIPPSKWLLFHISSTNAKDIQEMTHKFYLDFLPSCKYNLREIPELEYYHDNVTDFLVPIY